MESTRPACIPPPVGFHVMKNLCRVEGEADLTMRICSTHMHTCINKRALADARASLAAPLQNNNVADARLWKLLEDIFQISQTITWTPNNIRWSQKFF